MMTAIGLAIGWARLLKTMGTLMLPLVVAYQLRQQPSPSLLVTSADGTEGFALARALLDTHSPTGTAHRVVASVANRSSAAAERLASLGADVRSEDDPAVFRSVGWALILPPLTADRLERGTAMIEAAAKAGVPNAYLLSVIGADRPNAPPSLAQYYALEKKLAEAYGRSGGTSAVLRTFFYSSNLMLWASDVRAKQALRLPLTGCLALLYETDVARVVAALAAANTLPSPSHTVYELSGPAWRTGDSLAAAASAATGSRVSFEQVSADTAADILKAAAGLDASEAKLLVDLLHLQQGGGGEASECEGAPPLSGDIERLTGKPASTAERFFEEEAAAFRPP